MKRVEFEALLKLQDRYLLLCTVHITKHKEAAVRYSADIEDRQGNMVMTGSIAKTPAAAVQKSIAKYYKQDANH